MNQLDIIRNVKEKHTDIYVYVKDMFYTLHVILRRNKRDHLVTCLFSVVVSPFFLFFFFYFV